MSKSSKVKIMLSKEEGKQYKKYWELYCVKNESTGNKVSFLIDWAGLADDKRYFCHFKPDP